MSNSLVLPLFPSIDRLLLNANAQFIFDASAVGYNGETGIWRAATPTDLAGAGVTLGISGTVSTIPKQFGTQSNFSIASGNGTVFTLGIGEIGFLRNLNTGDPLYWKRGSGCTANSFSDILFVGQTLLDGKGNYATIDDWIGAVSVSGASANYMAYKLS